MRTPAQIDSIDSRSSTAGSMASEDGGRQQAAPPEGSQQQDQAGGGEGGQEGGSTTRQGESNGDGDGDGAGTEQMATRAVHAAAPATDASADANATAGTEQERSQHETGDGGDPCDASTNTAIALPDEEMAAWIGYNLDLSTLPPGAYLVEPTYPRGNGEPVLTAEVRLARDEDGNGDGDGAEEDESATGDASRSSVSAVSSVSTVSAVSALTMHHPNFAEAAASSRNSGGTGTITDDTNIHHVVTATCVDEECIVDARPVLDEDETALQVQAEHRQQIVAMRKRQHGFFGGAVLALVVLAVVLAVVFGGGGGGNSDANEGVDTAGSAQVDTDRLEALRTIVLPLSGSGVFDPTSPAYSEQRVATLEWLANDRYATEQLPTDDPSLTWKIRQRYVVGLFHIMTDSSNWFDDFNGLTDQDECDWNRGSSFKGTDFTGVEKEVEVKGILCDAESGRVERIIYWWNNLSGQLPHELSYISDSLIDLNIGGGSITGPIPDSYGNLTKLDNLSLNEHCFTGTVPESLSQLSEMAFLSLQGNSELGGSLNGLCDGDQFRSGTSLSFMQSDCGDCPNSETSIECECCTCCDSNTFDCCDKDGNALWKYINFRPSPSSGQPLSLERDCLTEEGALWVEEECPCVIYRTEEQVFGECTNECI